MISKYKPFYTLEERKSTLPDSGWNESEAVNYRRILRHDKNKNKLAHKALDEGMTGILFRSGRLLTASRS